MPANDTCQSPRLRLSVAGAAAACWSRVVLGNHAEMPKRLFDRFTLFGWARLDPAIATDALCPTHGGYATNLLDVSDPSRFRDEAVVTLHERLDLGGRGHFMPP